MSMIRYEPWSLINQISRDWNHLFDTMPANSDEHGNLVASDWVPAVDIKEEDQRFVIHADVPGVDPESIDVHMEAGVLSISGERHAESSEERKGYKRVERVRGARRMEAALRAHRAEKRGKRPAVEMDQAAERKDDQPADAEISRSTRTRSSLMSRALRPIIRDDATNTIAIPRHVNSLLLRRYASRIRRLSRLRTTAPPSRLPAAKPTRQRSVGGSATQRAVRNRPRTCCPSRKIRVNSGKSPSKRPLMRFVILVLSLIRRR